MSWQAVDMAARVAVVCGAGAGGVGTSTSRALAGAGATLFVVDRTEDLVGEVVDELRRSGARVEGRAADLRVPEQVAEVVPAAMRAFGRIDMLANVAGGTQVGQWSKFEETPLEVYRAVMALNLDYVFQVCRDCASEMLKSGGGAIVNVSSVSGLRAAPYHGPYGAAKAAVVKLTETMAIEWGPRGIRANVVVPGPVRTPRAGNRTEKFKTFAPLRRAVEPDEIANAIVFLLSDLAAAITGQTLVVDAGIAAKSALGDLSDMTGALTWRPE